MLKEIKDIFENFRKGLETIKGNQMEILMPKNIIQQKIMNCSLDGFKCRLQTAEEWICELEVKLEENIQNKEWKNKREKKKQKRR